MSRRHQGVQVTDTVGRCAGRERVARRGQGAQYGETARRTAADQRRPRGPVGQQAGGHGDGVGHVEFGPVTVQRIAVGPAVSGRAAVVDRGHGEPAAGEVGGGHRQASVVLCGRAAVHGDDHRRCSGTGDVVRIGGRIQHGVDAPRRCVAPERARRRGQLVGRRSDHLPSAVRIDHHELGGLHVGTDDERHPTGAVRDQITRRGPRRVQFGQLTAEGVQQRRPPVRTHQQPTARARAAQSRRPSTHSGAAKSAGRSVRRRLPSARGSMRIGCHQSLSSLISRTDAVRQEARRDDRNPGAAGDGPNVARLPPPDPFWPGAPSSSPTACPGDSS